MYTENGTLFNYKTFKIKRNFLIRKPIEEILTGKKKKSFIFEALFF